MYKFALRILLADWIGSECWVTLFNEKAVQVLGFTGNAYMNMTSDAERTIDAAGGLCHGHR